MNTNLSISFFSAMFTFWLRSSNEPPSEALKANNFASVALMLVSPLWNRADSYPIQMRYKYSLLMHRIKIKSPAIFFMGWTTRFCVLIHHFSISLTLAVLQRQISLPDIGLAVLPRCRLPRYVPKSTQFVLGWYFDDLVKFGDRRQIWRSSPN